MTKLTKKKLRSLIKDEQKASKEYRRYGLTSIARDETRHSRSLKKKLGKR
jgi:rubrerythrin